MCVLSCLRQSAHPLTTLCHHGHHLLFHLPVSHSDHPSLSQVFLWLSTFTERPGVIPRQTSPLQTSSTVHWGPASETQVIHLQCCPTAQLMTGIQVPGPARLLLPCIQSIHLPALLPARRRWRVAYCNLSCPMTDLALDGLLASLLG